MYNGGLKICCILGEMKELELEARLKGDGRPDLNPALGADITPGLRALTKGEASRNTSGLSMLASRASQSPDLFASHLCTLLCSWKHISLRK